jgi:hypothetical protein
MGRFPRLVLFFSLVLVSAESIGQSKAKKKDAWSTAYYKKLKSSYLASPIGDSAFPLRNFSAIRFVDARFDSSSIGYTRNSRFGKLSTKEGLSNYLAKKFSTEKSNAKQPELLCIVQHFMISEADTVINKDYGKGQSFNRLFVKADVFVNIEEQYRAAFRFDTTITDLDHDDPTKGTVINIFTKAMAVRIDKIAIEKILTKKAYSLTEIKESIQEKFQVPILTDSIYRKGVYVDFKDFCNNNPTYKDYKVKTGKVMDDIYIKDADGTPYIATKIFGFSDGKKIWIKYRNNFFLMHRNENTFHFFGFASATINKGVFLDPTAFAPMLGIPYPGFSSPVYVSDRLDTSTFRAFVLDMEKGIIF